MQTEHTPLNWLQSVASSLGWPVVVFAAFWLGQYVAKLRVRAEKMEANVQALTFRHMPAIHRALAELRGLLMRN